MTKPNSSRRSFIKGIGIVCGGAAFPGVLGGVIGNVLGADDTNVATKTIPVLGDPTFQQGFIISGPEHSTPPRIETYDQSGVKPRWGLRRWHSRGKFDQRVINDNEVLMRDCCGEVNLDRKTGAIELVVDTKNEYDQPRTSGSQPWTHLLLEQSPFDAPITLTRAKHVWANIDFEMTKYVDYGDNDPGLHAAQFSWFIYLKNQDKNSPGYGDFLWFGLSFFDNRHEFVPLYANQDFAMPNGSFIYTLGSKLYLDAPPTVGRRFPVHYDILPHIIDAMDTAKERGFLTQSQYQEMTLDGMNIGWEIPGMFEVGVRINSMQIEVVE